MTFPESQPQPEFSLNEFSSRSESNKKQLGETLSVLMTLMISFKEGDTDKAEEMREMLVGLPFFETLGMTDKTKLTQIINSLQLEDLDYYQEGFGSAALPKRSDAANVLYSIIKKYQTVS